jgi:hypothetical protein
MRRIRVRAQSAGLAAMVGAALATLVATTAAAAPVPIAPGQIFLGQVNGSIADATLTVVCPGPATSGHPTGDTVSVMKLQDPIPGFGRTGNAHRIDATLSWSRGGVDTVARVTSFTTYRTKKVPTSLVVPCSGPGLVTFTPRNGGHDATPTTVGVTFLNIGA